jgi:Uma2 family endonuclease
MDEKDASPTIKDNAIKSIPKSVKFDIYQREGVAYYILVNPHEKVAKVYGLKDGRFIKQGDFHKENYEFNIGHCNISFDFSKIWREVGRE